MSAGYAEKRGQSLFFGRVSLAEGALAQGTSSQVRYTGILRSTDPETGDLKIESYQPDRLLPGATYIAHEKPVCMAVAAGDVFVVVCLNETVLDGVCPVEAAQQGTLTLLPARSLASIRGDADAA